MKYLIALLLFLSTTIAQVTDKNFKDKVAKGVIVIKFTSKWQEKPIPNDLLKGIKGYQKAVIIEVAKESAPKLVKKLRIRNYPSLAMFHNGSNKKVWKSDMDGIIDVKNKDIKKAIDGLMAGDVF